jgi:hypothetical protein
MPDTFDLSLTVAEPEADATRRYELAGFLLSELRTAPVGDARRDGTGTAVPGSRGMDLQEVGALLVALQSTTGLLTDVATLITVVRGWLARSREPARKVVVTYRGTSGDATQEVSLELSNATAAQQDELVAGFVAALAKRLDHKDR